MHYYKKNIGDYSKKAGRLSILQHGVYNLLIDCCYDRERFPTFEEAVDWVWAGTKEEIEAVEFVLRKFFVLEDGVYVQKRIQQEIQEYHEFCQLQGERGKNGGRPKKPETPQEKPGGFSEEPGGKPTGPEKKPNHKPLTTNHKPNKNNYSHEFEQAWADYPKRQGSNSKAKAWAAWKARLSDGVDVETLAQSVCRYHRYCQVTGKLGTEFVMQGARFFGPDREFENDWSVSDETSSRDFPGQRPASGGAAERNEAAIDAAFQDVPECVEGSYERIE